MPLQLQSNEKERFGRIVELLAALNLVRDSRSMNGLDEIRALTVLALSDETTPNPKPALSQRGLPFSAAAGTNPVFAYVANRRGVNHIDRETRDYVFPVLIDVGVAQLAWIASSSALKESGQAVFYGEHRPKSPNNAYALTPDVRALLASPTARWKEDLESWLASDQERRRRVLERRSDVAVSRASGANPHSELIQAACNALIQTVAHGFRVVFVDDEDGQRVRSDYASELERLDLMPDLASKWPDAILLSDEETAVWFIDAVTSDGEIDGPRADALKKWAREKGYDTAGLTTAYKTWARLATRQTTYRNLALGSTVWIAEDGGKLLTVGALVP